MYVFIHMYASLKDWVNPNDQYAQTVLFKYNKLAFKDGLSVQTIACLYVCMYPCSFFS